MNAMRTDFSMSSLLRRVVLGTMGLLLSLASSEAASYGLSGRVVNTLGIGVPEVVVTVRSRGTQHVLGTTATDKDGRYRLENIPETTISVDATSPGFVSFKQDAWIGEDTVLHIALLVGDNARVEPNRVQGVVRGPDGAALADAAVRLAMTYRPDIAIDAMANARGQFALETFEAGAFIVIASKPCFDPAVLQVRVERRKPTPPVELTLKKNDYCKEHSAGRIGGEQ